MVFVCVFVCWFVCLRFALFVCNVWVDVCGMVGWYLVCFYVLICFVLGECVCACLYVLCVWLGFVHVWFVLGACSVFV